MTSDTSPQAKARLDKLERQVNDLADEVLALLTPTDSSTASPTPRAGSSPEAASALAPAAWVDMDEQQAAAALDRLQTWITHVLIHHPRTMTRLRPCWYRHPATVQMLLDVHKAWKHAYRGPSTDPFPALEWWQRHLPRLDEELGADLGHCTSVRHDPDRVPLPPDASERIRAYLAWWGGQRRPEDEPAAP